ncbi:hypothetical protein CASFOL_005225 [Castilleja foliolosa]|uniref:RNase H type-1 domain-containing protein n=1 Tax=Castilleja foliolosa TaxID=1961234 RepID=A0ABD3E3E1_9LAMI
MVVAVSRSCKAHWHSMAQSCQGLDLPAKPWKPPPDSWIKVNVDTAYANNIAYTGVVFRDSLGSILFTASFKHSCLDATAAESLAILDACEKLIKQRMDKVIIESDCLNVITFINVDSVNCLWTAAPMIEEIRRLKLKWSS